MPLLISADVKCQWAALLQRYLQQAQHEGTPFSAEATGKLNQCLGGGNPLAVPLLQISCPVHHCCQNHRLGTSKALVMLRLLPCPYQPSFPFHPHAPDCSHSYQAASPAQTSAHYVLIIQGL